MIKGAKEIINRDKPKIIFEYDKRAWDLAKSSISEAFIFLKNNDYEIYNLNNKNGKLKKANIKELRKINSCQILVK